MKINDIVCTLYTEDVNSDDGLAAFRLEKDFDIHDAKARKEVIDYAKSELGTPRAFILIESR